MFSATEPLASAPLATSGTSKIITGSASLISVRQVLSGSAEASYVIFGGGNLLSAAQKINGASYSNRFISATAGLTQKAQILSGLAIYSRLLEGSANLSNAPQGVSGIAGKFRLLQASGSLSNGVQTVYAICYEIRSKRASAALSSAVQSVSADGTVLVSIDAAGTMLSAAHGLLGAATRIRLLEGSGALVAPPQELYGSELWPIWIKTPITPVSLYEVSRKITSEPSSTANGYLTIYQVPGYRELQPDGTYVDVNATAIITAMSAVTDAASPQNVSIIVVRVSDLKSYTVMPAYTVTTGVQNIMPMRDFNLVTGDVIQVKSAGLPSVTVNMSILLNTQK